VSFILYFVDPAKEYNHNRYLFECLISVNIEVWRSRCHFSETGGARWYLWLPGV